MEPPIARITLPYRVETEMFTAHCAAGGVNNAGAVFKITPRGKYRVLYTFDVVHVLG